MAMISYIYSLMYFIKWVWQFKLIIEENIWHKMFIFADHMNTKWLAMCLSTKYHLLSSMCSCHDIWWWYLMVLLTQTHWTICITVAKTLYAFLGSNNKLIESVISYNMLWSCPFDTLTLSSFISVWQCTKIRRQLT